MRQAFIPLMPLGVLVCICLERVPASGVAAALTLPVPIGSRLGAVGVVVVNGPAAVGAFNCVCEPTEEIPNHQRILISRSHVVIRRRPLLGEQSRSGGERSSLALSYTAALPIELRPHECGDEGT